MPFVKFDELVQEIRELHQLGLSEEEIEGYLEFFRVYPRHPAGERNDYKVRQSG